MKTCFTSLLLIFFTNQIIAQNLGNLSFGTDSTFEVVSWNIEWFPKNGQTTANYVQIILTNLQADVYALQEIDDTTLLKQVVANIPGYECYFKSDWFAGLAYVYNTNRVQINAKYEIFATSQYWNAFPRSPQVLELSFMNEDYVIINNHFKCCGDGTLNTNDPNDEENRRLTAVTLLKQYIDSLFTKKRVIVVGDLNDILTDASSNNVFQTLIDDTANYVFADMQIAQGSNNDWSYPTWPSHLDHVLITNEMFTDFAKSNSEIRTIKIDNYMSNWYAYENNISDHRPVGLKLATSNTTSVFEETKIQKKLIRIVDVLGRETQYKKNTLLFFLYEDGRVERILIIN
jgi:endonuclease/exonuclease/phosphatase family metal-dependent hydrolase